MKNEKTYKISYHDSIGHCIEIDSNAPSHSIIYSLRIKAANTADAFLAFINEGVKRHHLTAATAERYKGMIRAGTVGMRLR